MLKRLAVAISIEFANRVLQQPRPTIRSRAEAVGTAAHNAISLLPGLWKRAPVKHHDFSAVAADCSGAYPRAAGSITCMHN